MDAQAIWLIVLSIATPLAGIVGFAIQLRQLKAAKLENAKLQLEIQELHRKASAESVGITIATPTEIRRLREGDVVFSLVSRDDESKKHELSFRKSFKERIGEVALMATVLLVIAYAIYDLIRLVRWIAGGF